MRTNDWPALSAYQAKGFTRQRQAIIDVSRFVHVSAPVRTGKTFANARRFVRRLNQDRKAGKWADATETVYWAVAPTLALTIVQKKELIDLIPSWQVDWRRQGTDERWQNTARGGGVVYLVGGGKIEFKTADDPESLVAEKLRGYWVTEAARVGARAHANLRARISNYTDSWACFDTSPMGRCAYWQDYIEPLRRKAMPDSTLYEWTLGESPFVPRAEIENARLTLPSSFFKRDYEASWDTFQGQIYDWSDALHFKPLSFMPDFGVVAVDVNTTSQHPASFLTMLASGQGEQARAWVRSEYREVIGLDYARYVRDIKAAVVDLRKVVQDVRLIIDPSFHNELKEDLRNAGLTPINADNEVLPGIRCMGSALKGLLNSQPRLTVNPVCKFFGEEARGYSWKLTPDGLCKPEPDKSGMEGLMDAGRYACMSVFSGWRTGVKQVR